MTPFSQLAKILNYERSKGCTNTTVIGGLETFIANWAQGNLTEDPTRIQLVNQIQEALHGYGEAGAEARGMKLGRAIALAQSEPAPAHGRRPRPGPKPSEEQGEQEAKSWGAKRGRKLDERASEPGSIGSAVAEEEAEVEALASPDAGFGLDAPVNRLQGVGSAHAKRLEKLGVKTVQDLLTLYPRRHIDYRRLKNISQLMYGEEVTLIAKVSVVNTRVIRGNLTITNVLLVDQTGSINATYFNQPYLSRQLRPGTQIVVSGRVDRDLNRVCFKQPEWERVAPEQLHTARLVPVYPLTEGLSSRWVRNIVHQVVEYWADKVADPLPPEVRHRAHLVDLKTALNEIHFPSTPQDLEAARRRLAFEELLLIQLGVLRQRRKWRMEPAMALPVRASFAREFGDLLPYTLTKAQNRALGEILEDIRQPAPMSRLLQGDVGSGKTVVAAAAMLAAAMQGYQSVLMAPTEILAEQHLNTIQGVIGRAKSLVGAQPRVDLLTGSLRPREKAQIQDAIAAGEVQMAVGTHALIQEAVNFNKLALAVIDEQHRFGVSQRSTIRQKGYNPHVLVMSATPIPRTLALTVFGDLDLSILDEMPPGRQEIKTKWLEPRERERAYAFIRKQVAEGRQAFVICPLIEESEAVDARAAVEEFERLSKEVYPDLRVGLIHGKLRPGEKEAAMSAFHDGQIQVLVATSVVEVGIDVPNATVMLIEGADRFGLAQLHQFRGRVGRGEHPSFCLLLAEKSASTSDERLKVIETTQDGFRLAEEDLKLRGPGEFFGTRQSGLPDLKVAKLSDMRILEEARATAQDIFSDDPEMQLAKHQLLRQKVQIFWHGEGDLS